jgi:hypothetical protein
MANFQTPTNAKRVQKILDILDLLEHSRQSNRAGKPAMQDMLGPLTLRLWELIGQDPRTHLEAITTADQIDPQPKPPAAGKWSVKDMSGVDIRDVAAAAPLRHLSYAMAVYINRIDDVIDNQ